MASKSTIFSPQPIVGSFDRRFLRTDFRRGSDGSDFDSLLESQTLRLGWARSIPCTCVGLSGDKDQRDPTCPECNAIGLRYFRPEDYSVDPKQVGKLNALQTRFLDEMEAVVIKGYISGITYQRDLFAVVGEWGFGGATLTVRPENRIGHGDRLVQLDAMGPYTEVVTVSGNELATRYPVHSVNFVGSLTARYGDKDLALSTDGKLTWKDGKAPTTGTRVSVHYLCHPVYLVVEHPNFTRHALVDNRVANPDTPDGDILELPLRVLLKREHLVLNMKERAL